MKSDILVLAEVIEMQNETIATLSKVMTTSFDFLAHKSGEVHGMVQRMMSENRGKYRAARPGRRWK